MGPRVSLAGELKPIGGGVAKASPKWALVCRIRSETRRSSHGQSEGRVTPTGGSNRYLLKKIRMTCG